LRRIRRFIELLRQLAANELTHSNKVIEHFNSALDLFSDFFILRLLVRG
jgi:hypothetical protein